MRPLAITMLSLTNQNKVHQPRGEIYRHISEPVNQPGNGRRDFALCPSVTARYSGDPEQPGRTFCLMFFIIYFRSSFIPASD